MKFTLKRTECGAFGAFGILNSEDGSFACNTLEHAYPCGSDFTPKVPAGSYRCQLGPHQLSTGPQFQAYEIQNVPGHSNILIHPGNTQGDSSGCILVGLTRGAISGVPAVLQSRLAFQRFMELTAGAQTIELEVIDD